MYGWKKHDIFIWTSYRKTNKMIPYEVGVLYDAEWLKVIFTKANGVTKSMVYHALTFSCFLKLVYSRIYSYRLLFLLFLYQQLEAWLPVIKKYSADQRITHYFGINNTASCSKHSYHHHLYTYPSFSFTLDDKILSDRYDWQLPAEERPRILIPSLVI